MWNTLATVGRSLTRPYDAVTDVVERRDWVTGIIIPAVVIGLLLSLMVIVPTGQTVAERWLGAGTGALLFGGTFFAAAGVVFLACRLVHGQPEWRSVLAAWGVTYVPTGGWFLIMILSHLIFPGPQPYLGTFQIVFAIISLAFFLWKLLLYYFALRLAGQLSFRQIVLATAMLAPVAMAYWVVGYWLGLFKVPLI